MIDMINPIAINQTLQMALQSDATNQPAVIGTIALIIFIVAIIGIWRMK